MKDTYYVHILFALPFGDGIMLPPIFLYVHETAGTLKSLLTRRRFPGDSSVNTIDCPLQLWVFAQDCKLRYPHDPSVFITIFFIRPWIWLS